MELVDKYLEVLENKLYFRYGYNMNNYQKMDYAVLV